LGDGLRDFDPRFLIVGERERDFRDATLPLLDLAFSECSLALRDFTESFDFERLRDFLIGECGEPDRERTTVSPEASISAK
jgi:hypothetical protein